MTPLEIDGSFGEGGGQILRSAVSLSCITGKPIRIRNIRSNRKVPGLQAQHLLTIKLLAKISGAKVEGLSHGSTSVTFAPQQMQDTSLTENVGTAGSIPLILQALLPAVALSGKKMDLKITGGTDVPWSPTSNYTKYVLGEAYSRIGIDFSMNVQRRGYYPRGGGQVQVTVNPCSNVKPVHLSKRTQKTAKIICSCTDLTEQISTSIDSTKETLQTNGFSVQAETRQEKASNAGGSLLVFSSDSSSITGADELLDIKNPAQFGSKSASAFLQCGFGVDTNLSDMLVMPLSLCRETSVITVKQISKHLETNLYITSKITDCKYGIGKVDGGYEVRIRGP